MKLRSSLAAFITLWIGISTTAMAAETLFYSNIKPAGFTSTPLYINSTYTNYAYEWADDIPFTGTHLVSSFKVGYRSSEPVLATFRFYGVDQNTGLPGALSAEIMRELPAGEATPTIVLDQAEQFLLSAEPNLRDQNLSGGWFSVRYQSIAGTISDATFRLAGYTSRSGLYNIDNDTLVTILDPSGLIPTSMYLQVYSVDSTDIPVPQIESITLIPNEITAGDSGRIFVRLDGQAPEGGVVVKLTSSNPKRVFVNPEVTIPAGGDNIATNYSTRKRVRKGGANVEITVETNNSTSSATLRVNRR